MSDNDERLLRKRIEELLRLIESVKKQPQTHEAFVGTTFQLTTYPTVANRFYAIHPDSIAGIEDEGQTVTAQAKTGHIFALNLGSTIPPVGTKCVIHYVPNRFVFIH